MPFLFEKLDVYQKAKQVAEALSLLLQNPPKGGGNTADQLRRASSSIVLNLAEGSGRWHVADRCQFFWISRGSVNECVPLLDEALQHRMISPEQRAQFRSDFDLIGRMITRLIQYNQSKKAT